MNLSALLKKDAVPFETLHDRYGSLLKLVRMLIGVVPKCDPYLEIWPTAFRTYNVMVPNFINLPFLVWGMGAPRDVLGLAMYTSSRTAACMYCSAHCCSFALRRGAAPATVAASMDEDKLDARERSAVAVAKALSRVPADITHAQRQELRRHFSGNADWIVLGVAMMGFLNKFMDALGVELEASTVQEVDGVIGASGWTPGKHMDEKPAAGPPPPADSLFTQVSVLRHAPSALSLDKKWTAGVPDRWPAVGEYLRARTGHDFPLLSRLPHRRAIRALATMLRDNLDPAASVVGLPRKLAAGLIYAEMVESPTLASQLKKLGPSESDPVIEKLARAISPSPAVVDDEVADACRSLSGAALVEVVTFISVLQLVHRLEAFYS